MDKKEYSRRRFLKRNLMTGLGVVLAADGFSGPWICGGNTTGQPALLGGEPVHSGNWPGWPVWNASTDEEQLLNVIRSGVWSRAGVVDEFEKAWAQTIGTKRCLSVVNGTNALIASLVNLGIGGGDEVIIPSYTFIATAIAVLQAGAMPVFADTDPATFQVDPDKIEQKISPRTRAIIPVHILGLPADMERILSIARRHNLLVIEDACQAPLAGINHKNVGSFGHAGCFSFQNSKNLPIGEGGAITSNDDELMDRCYSYHNYGNPYGTSVGAVGAGTIIAGTKLRITEYQAAIGLSQMKRLEEQTRVREVNAAYLKSRIGLIPGIIPYKLYPGVTRAVFHLFPFRYFKEEFQGLSRELFLKALTAEGIPCSGGYAPLNKMPYLDHAFRSKNFQKMYPREMLDFNRYLEQNQCPENDRLCQEEAVWIPQNMLLAAQTDMDDISRAIEKIHEHAGALKEKAEKK